MISKFEKQCLFINRQPTLTRHSVPFVHVKPIEEAVIKLSPLFVEPLNADFDGDALALYGIYDRNAIKEASANAFLRDNIKYDESEDYISTIRHEAQYGVFLLSKNYNNLLSESITIDKLENTPENIDLYNKPNTTVIFNNNKYSYGICLLNKWMGFDRIILNKLLGKKEVNQISNAIFEYYNDNQIYHEWLSNLERNIFFYISVANYYSATIDLNQMLDLVDDNTRNLFKKIPNSIKLGYLINESLIERCLDKFKNKESTLLNLMKSGSRFSAKQLSRSFINLGFTANSDNQIICKSINSNLISGLTEDEFFIGADGSRKGKIMPLYTVTCIE